MKNFTIISLLLVVGFHGFGQSNSTFGLKSDIPNYIDSNGLKQGLWKEELNQDNIGYFITTYVDGIKDGQYRAFNINGNVAVEGHFKNDSLNGKVKQYYETGELKILTEYEMGVLVNKQIDYWENGNIQASESFKNGITDGVYKWFYESGKLRAEWEIVMDVETGFYKYYHENGQLQFTGNRINGKKEGKFMEFNEEGDLIKTFNYKNGEEIK